MSEHLWAVNMLKAPKHCLYLHCSIFVIFFHQSEIKSARKIRKFFFFIPEIYIKFWILWKKRWASEIICFWNYRLQKAGLLKCLKNVASEHLLSSQHVKPSKTLLKSARQYFCHIFWPVWNKISSKSYVLVLSRILRLFFNILTPDEKYAL